MLAHCNRWLLPSAALYVALLTTNALNFWRSLSLSVGGLCAIFIVVAGLRNAGPRVPSPGKFLMAAFVAWCAWCTASLLWSQRPGYSENQWRGEIMWNTVLVLMVYVAAADARAWRIVLKSLLAVFALAATFAVLLQFSPWGWNPGRWHLGVGPWTTYLVLLTPFLVTLLLPPPAGLGVNRRAYTIAAALMVLVLATARISDNRMVWVALAVAMGVIGGLGALRWRGASASLRMRWLLPLMLLLVVTVAALFADAAREKAEAFFPPDTPIAQTLADDPRLALWEHMVAHIRMRPWTGFGFGRAILASQLRSELGDPLLWHAHNLFGSQWLQTGAIGLALFLTMLGALTWRYVQFFRAPGDALAVVGIIGLALLAGFVMKNLTDDFLFRANAKQFFALNALLIGWGTRLERAEEPAATPETG